MRRNGLRRVVRGCGGLATGGVAQRRHRWGLVYAVFGCALVGPPPLLGAGAAVGAAAEAREPRVSDVTAIQAFAMVRQWVDGWDTTGEDELGPGSAIAGLECVAVVLRLNGDVIGAGEVYRTGGGALREAARLAMERAAASSPGLANEAGLRGRVAVDVEIGGELTPLDDADFGAAAGRLSPGQDGAVARVGNRYEARFPVVGIGRGDLPLNMLRRAVAGLDLPPVDLAGLRKHDGLVVYRFEGVRVAQPSAELGAVFLHRGGRLVTEGDVRRGSLVTMADAAMEYLRGGTWHTEEPFGLRGEYDAVADTYDPYVAGPIDQAIGAFALARLSVLEDLPSGRRAVAHRAARDLVGAYVGVDEREADPLASAGGCAAWIAAQGLLAGNLEGAVEAEEFEAKAQGVVLDALRGAGELSGPELAMVACCAAMGADRFEDPARVRALAGAAQSRLLESTPAAGLVALAPWIVWGELELAEEGSPVRSSIALRAMREAAWGQQITEADVTAREADLVGGLVFTRGTTPLPTWQGLRVFAAVGSMLSDGSLTEEGEWDEELLKLRTALRFAMQLAVTRVEATNYPNTGRSMGGVRPAVWVHRVSPGATAMAILTACEALDGLSRRPWGSRSAIVE